VGFFTSPDETSTPFSDVLDKGLLHVDFTIKEKFNCFGGYDILVEVCPVDRRYLRRLVLIL
jgi:hypothetical protein